MKQLTIEDLKNLSIGSAILGSGGGGDPSYALLMVKYLIERYGPINIVSVEELKENDLIIPLSFMGAPLINMERIQSGKELDLLLQTIEKRLQKKPTVLMAAEIGGANAFTPFLVAAKLGLPVLDADMIGRAFPELQMSSCYLKKLKATPAVITDCLGNSVVIETKDAQTLEKIARSVTVAMGSSSAVGFYFMTKKEAQIGLIHGTLSQALKLGEAISNAIAHGKDPIAQCIVSSNAIIIGRGTIVDIDQNIDKGFLQGSVTILNGKEKIKLFYQNEFLLARTEDKILASTPDILTLLEETSGTPITSESLRYGLQVALIVISTPEIWKTAEGLKLVGPQAFGYDIDYQSVLKKIKEDIAL